MEKEGILWVRGAIMAEKRHPANSQMSGPVLLTWEDWEKWRVAFCLVDTRFFPDHITYFEGVPRGITFPIPPQQSLAPLEPVPHESLWDDQTYPAAISFGLFAGEPLPSS
jgi:hypothetical protein